MQRISHSRPVLTEAMDRYAASDGHPLPGSDRTIAPVGITTLAPAFVQALPTLDTVPTAYSHEFHAELLYDLCAALVREGLGGPETWRKCDESAMVFAQRAIMESIGEERWNLLQRNVEYHLSVSDVAERDGDEALLGEGRLAVTIECSGCGFLKIGPAIAALEEEAEGLGAAFYWTLTYALYRVMRIYNHDDALQYEERMKEYAEDDEENREQYEFPEVEKALPECIRKTLDARRPLLIHAERAPHSSPACRRTVSLLDRAAAQDSAALAASGCRLTFTFAKTAAMTRFLCRPCWWPSRSTTPSSRVSMKRANTCWKAARSRPWVSSSPRRSPKRCGARCAWSRRFVALNCELFQLVEELQEWEKCHAGTYLDRGEPSLRAA